LPFVIAFPSGFFQKTDFFDKDIMVKIDFTYDKEIEDKFNLKKFVSQIQKTRKAMGLHVWNKISIEIEFDEIGIIKNNIDYMKKRLECDINPFSQKKAELFYETDSEQIKKIGYTVSIY